MRFVRPALCLAAAASVLAFVVPSDAAPAYKSKTLTVADDTGDANAVNDQGLGLTDGSAPAVGYDGYDIVKLAYKSTGVMVKRGRLYVPRCTGFTVTMALAAAPGPQAIYRVTGVGVNQDALWWLQYDGKEATLRYGHADSGEVTGSTDDSITLKTPIKIAEGNMTWTVLESDVKATDEKLSKLRVSGIGASIRTTTGVVTVPQWDAIPEGDASFKPC